MRNQDQLVGDILQDLVKDMNMGPKLAQSQIRSLWQSELGQMINRHTTDIRFAKGVLRVRVNSAPLRQELSYNKAHLMQVLNSKLRDERIESLEIR